MRGIKVPQLELMEFGYIKQPDSRMSVSILDSALFKNLFGTQEIRDVFTDEAYIRRMIDTEAALARAQSKEGVIPPEAGEKITQAVVDIALEYDYPLSLSAWHWHF